MAVCCRFSVQYTTVAKPMKKSWSPEYCSRPGSLGDKTSNSRLAFNLLKALYASLIPPLSAMFSRSVIWPFTCNTYTWRFASLWTAVPGILHAYGGLTYRLVQLGHFEAAVLVHETFGTLLELGFSFGTPPDVGRSEIIVQSACTNDDIWLSSVIKYHC